MLPFPLTTPAQAALKETEPTLTYRETFLFSNSVDLRFLNFVLEFFLHRYCIKWTRTSDMPGRCRRWCRCCSEAHSSAPMRKLLARLERKAVYDQCHLDVVLEPTADCSI